jgi:hypothetical protein
MVSFVLNLTSKGDFVLQAYIIDCQVEIQLFHLLQKRMKKFPLYGSFFNLV